MPGTVAKVYLITTGLRWLDFTHFVSGPLVSGLEPLVPGLEPLVPTEIAYPPPEMDADCG